MQLWIEAKQRRHEAPVSMSDAHGADEQRRVRDRVDPAPAFEAASVGLPGGQKLVHRRAQRRYHAPFNRPIFGRGCTADQRQLSWHDGFMDVSSGQRVTTAHVTSCLE